MPDIMFSANLYLPESLYPKQPPATERPSSSASSQNASRKYFERKSTQRKSREDDSSARTSTASSRKSSEVNRNDKSSLNTVFSFVDFANSLGGVSKDNEIFVKLIQRVRHDVAEASRLYTSHAVEEYLEAWPDKKTWIDAILLDVQRALNDIGVYVEDVRVTGDDGGAVALKRKFEWVLGHHRKLISRELNLTLCHQSLMATIQVMQTAEMSAHFGGHDPIHEAPGRPWLPGESETVLRSPYSRQKWRTSQRNLSVPSITVSEAEGEDVETKSVSSFLVELPGSTPEDLPHPDNMDLYAPPPKPTTIPEQPKTHASVQQINMTPSPERVEPLDSSEEKTPVMSAEKSGSETPGEKLQFPPAPSQIPLRRSFDQPRPRVSPYHVRPRASLDQVRPRAYSDQVRPGASVRAQPRGPADQMQHMPTVSEKSVERNDSTTSTASFTKVNTMPMLAMRYRPRAVHVPKQLPVKHRSLPSELPYLPTQPSLITELSDWMLPTLARDSFRWTDANGSLDVSTPSTSITSSPTMPNSPASCPETFRPIASLSAETTMRAPTSAPSTAGGISKSAQSFHGVPIEDSPTIGWPSSLTIQSPPTSQPVAAPPLPPRPESKPGNLDNPIPSQPPPVPPRPRRSPDLSANSDAAQKAKPSESSPINTEAAITKPERKAAEDMPSETTPTTVSTFEMSASVKTEITEPEAAPKETSTGQPAPTPSRAPPRVPVTRPPIPAIPSSTSVAADTLTSTTPRSMTSQSKRRAAHARRMRLAYEKDE
ncbi:hypothetical protein BDV95DRAFT_249183 [Massariosphaeria phaeospora]|uniref:Uncharacterized protein n=1 Tax=Massariosphaeria phaeospora TaxID=100035 RepID=A0A7C8I1U9_9PLEO|nr:hypothetical protein BDV95DRAFT_249183 [Massariosphaeria phaeospora]